MVKIRLNLEKKLAQIRLVVFEKNVHFEFRKMTSLTEGFAILITT